MLLTPSTTTTAQNQREAVWDHDKFVSDTFMYLLAMLLAFDYIHVREWIEEGFRGPIFGLVCMIYRYPHNTNNV